MLLKVTYLNQIFSLPFIGVIILLGYINTSERTPFTISNEFPIFSYHLYRETIT